MATLKAYTVGCNGIVRREVLDTLGEPAHRRQAHVILVAPSKAAAVRAAQAVGFHVSPHDSEFRLTGGPLADSILAVATGPAVYASPPDSRAGQPVVRLDGGPGVRVGELVRYGFGFALMSDGGA